MTKKNYPQKKFAISLNKKPFKWILWSFLFVFILINISFYGCTEYPDNDNGKLSIATSILPVAGFIEQLCGDKAEVTAVVPPGADPHTFEPTPRLLEKISHADIYMMVGSGIDFELAWLDGIKGINPNMVFIDCSNGIDLIENTEEESGDKSEQAVNGYHADPHIWLSPKNAIVMVENIYSGLVLMDPSNEDHYRSNKIIFQDKLSGLDKKIRDILSGKKNKKILVFHPAWTYFARDYGIEQIPVEEDGKEPTIKGMMDLIDQAKKYNIRVIFASPEFSTKSAEIIADEIGGSVVLVSPLEKDYIDGLNKAAYAFSESME